jgi:nitroreductase
MSSIEELLRASRSIRRFKQEEAVPRETLQWLVGLARLCPSAANLQPLKFVLSNTPETNARIFPCLSWAGYLGDWPGPSEGERPSAYIIILGDTRITSNFGCDHGIVAQSIMLAARERGLGGCIIGSMNRHRLREALGIPERYEILLVLALGVPNEEVVLQEAKGDIRYWRDAQGVHHVPKRPLRELLLRLPPDG